MISLHTVKPIFISDCWWYHFPTPFGTYRIDFHFIFMIDEYGPQMIHRTFYTIIGGAPPPLFFPFLGPTFLVGQEERPDPPPFFHVLEHLFCSLMQLKKKNLCYMLRMGFYYYVFKPSSLFASFCIGLLTMYICDVMMWNLIFLQV